MKSYQLKNIKSELNHLDKDELIDLIQRLGRFKLENKELLTYELFYKNNRSSFDAEVKSTIDEIWEKLNTTSAFLAKKTIRKSIRIANKFARYSGELVDKIEFHLHILQLLIELPQKLKKQTSIEKIVFSETKIINSSISSLHEDLQYDYQRMLEKILNKN